MTDTTRARAEGQKLLTEAELEQSREEISGLYDEFLGLLRRSIHVAKRLGDELRAVKEGLPHGKFIPWVRKNFKWSLRTANDFMRISREWCSLEEEVKDNSHLSVERALRILRGLSGRKRGPGARSLGDRSLPSSAIRTVRLYLINKALARFRKRASALAEEYGTQNLTDTVYECVKRAFEGLR